MMNYNNFLSLFFLIFFVSISSFASKDNVEKEQKILNKSYENIEVRFDEADFKNEFNEIESGDLTKIKITSLPSNGVLRLFEENIVPNQEILAEHLGNLTFIPLAAWVGKDHFTWLGANKSGFIEESLGSSTLIEQFEPIVLNKTINTDVSIKFNSTDFKDLFVTTSCRKVEAVKIIALPQNGILKIAGKEVFVDQEIAPEMLDNLTYFPAINKAQEDSFGWSATDGVLYAKQPGYVHIVKEMIDGVNIQFRPIILLVGVFLL